MSYILDALKKSEQARGGRKSRRMFEELPESPPPPPRTSGVLRRWLYLIAFILFLNVSLFVFWAAPWRSSPPPPPAQHSPTISPKPLAPISQTTSPKPLAQTSRTTSPKPQASGISTGGPTAPKASGVPAHRPPAQALKQSPLRTAGVRKSPSLGVATPAAAARRSKAPKSPSVGLAIPAAAARRSKAPKSPSVGLATSGAAARRRRTELQLKAAALKALLEKQAAHAQKAARPHSRGQSFANARSFAAPNPANEPRVPSLGRLPYRIRETLPNMSVSMLDYSKRPADRFIIINGTKRHEGDEITPDLKLERITPDGAIFKYRGRRFYMSVLGY